MDFDNWTVRQTLVIVLSSEDILVNIEKVVKDSIPSGAVITNIDFEGPEVVIYTRNPSMLVSDADLIKELAKKLRKRVVIRPDAAIIMPEDQAVEMIKQLVPAEAEITDITFDPGISEVIIEAKKPGLAIGKSGSTCVRLLRTFAGRLALSGHPPSPPRLCRVSAQHLPVRAMSASAS